MDPLYVLWHPKVTRSQDGNAYECNVQVREMFTGKVSAEFEVVSCDAVDAEKQAVELAQAWRREHSSAN
jgi:hypothetical protein